jgi:hypothetical protein
MIASWPQSSTGPGESKLKKEKGRAKPLPGVRPTFPKLSWEK